MGIGDFVDKAKDLAAENKDAVEEGIDEAGDFLDEKTGGQHSDKIEQGEKVAKDLIEGLEED